MPSICSLLLHQPRVQNWEKSRLSKQSRKISLQFDFPWRKHHRYTGRYFLLIHIFLKLLYLFKLIVQVGLTNHVVAEKPFTKLFDFQLQVTDIVFRTPNPPLNDSVVTICFANIWQTFWGKQTYLVNFAEVIFNNHY